MQPDQLIRREFITLFGGAAATWPFATGAQQADRTRRIGVLMSIAESDPEGSARITAFRQALQDLGWTDGRNVQIDYRWAAGNPDRVRINAAEFVGLMPDVILANGSVVLQALERETRTIPIVFVQVADPVGAGFVASLAQPGGNITGFATTDYAMSGKWVEILKEIAPRVTRVVVIQDRQNRAGVGFFGAIQAVAPSFGVNLVSASVQDAADIERVISAFARGPSDGLIVLPGPLSSVRRDLIISLAASRQVPAIYPYPYFATSGGLVSYGVDNIDLYRRAASYVDRILKGEKPADLPVQQPTKYALVINIRTAKALGLDVPPTLIARADEVIE